LYFIGEKTLYQAEDLHRDMTLFYRFGRADKNINTFINSSSIGMRVRGLIKGRIDDYFGFASTTSKVSGSYLIAQSAAGIASPGKETAVEITYRAQVNPWLVVQPNAQRIFNPGLLPDVKPATVIGVQCEIAL
jgi:porin